MSKARNIKQTSRTVARQASAVLRDGRSSARSKSVAASALAQARPASRKLASSVRSVANWGPHFSTNSGDFSSGPAGTHLVVSVSLPSGGYPPSFCPDDS